MVKPERWREMEKRIRAQLPPRNNNQYRAIHYQSFKELAKLVLRYQTYYPGKYITEHDAPLQCPTCGKQCNGSSQLTKRRKNSPERQEQYWGEINQLIIFPNEGCDQIFETHKAYECHLRYRCGNGPNPFRNTTRPGHLDRTLRGYGIPPEDIRLYQGKYYSIIQT